MEFVIDQLTYDIYHECKLCRRRRLSYIEWCTWWVQKNETADCTNNRIVSTVIPCSLEQISLKATPLRAGPLWRARMIQIVFSWLIQAFCQPSLLQCKGNDLIVWLSSQVNTQDQYRSPTRITKNTIWIMRALRYMSYQKGVLICASTSTSTNILKRVLVRHFSETDCCQESVSRRTNVQC